MKITKSLSRLPVLMAILLLIGSSERSHAQDLYVGSNSSGQTTNFTSGTNSYSSTYVGYNAGLLSFPASGISTIRTQKNGRIAPAVFENDE